MGKRNIPDHIKEEYMNWLLTPPGEREPSSKKAFAEHHGIAYRTLYNWEEEEEFQAALRTIKGKWGARWHGDILGRLFDIVNNGSDSASISASKVLLNHLRIPTDDREEHELSSDQEGVIRELLEGAGYKVINSKDNESSE